MRHFNINVFMLVAYDNIHKSTNIMMMSHFKNSILACDLSLNLKCFNVFNYGQLLVHSRALLSSQIAYVVCFHEIARDK